MSRNIQEYINGLINKQRIYNLDLNNYIHKTESKQECPTCQKESAGKFYCQNCNSKDKLEGEITDLQAFTNLKGIGASNNQFTNLKFLDTLPNKEQLKKINLFGNQIKEIDFAELLTQFPNLDYLNLGNNPLVAKNLNNLSSEQFNKLVQGIKENKINIYSFKGTLLMDLLEHAQKLTTNGNNQQQQNARYLQTLIQHGSSPVKTDAKKNGDNNSLLIGGLITIAIASALIMGYLIGKNKEKY